MSKISLISLTLFAEIIPSMDSMNGWNMSSETLYSRESQSMDFNEQQLLDDNLI